LHENLRHRGEGEALGEAPEFLSEPTDLLLELAQLPVSLLHPPVGLQHLSSGLFLDLDDLSVLHCDRSQEALNFFPGHHPDFLRRRVSTPLETF
jgi:hypothetical protein